MRQRLPKEIWCQGWIVRSLPKDIFILESEESRYVPKKEKKQGHQLLKSWQRNAALLIGSVGALLPPVQHNQAYGVGVAL